MGVPPDLLCPLNAMRCSELLAAQGSFRGACWELELSILLPMSTLRSEEPAMCARRIWCEWSAAFSEHNGSSGV
jgi:hypothetical protein